MVLHNEQFDLRPASLRRVLRRGITDAWDHLGLVVASSLAWSIIFLIPFTLGWELQRRFPAGYPWLVIMGLAFGVLASSPVIAGIFRIAYKAVNRESVSLSDLIEGAAQSGWLTFKTIFINLLVIFLLIVDAAFFFGILGPLRGAAAAYIVGIVMVYLLLMWLVMAMYQMPALAAQKPLVQMEGTFAAVKKSFLLLIGNPGFTAGLFVVILCFSILCVVSVVGMLLLFIGTVSFFLTHALRELFVRYGVMEDLPDELEDKGWPDSRR